MALVKMLDTGNTGIGLPGAGWPIGWGWIRFRGWVARVGRLEASGWDTGLYRGRFALITV